MRLNSRQRISIMTLLAVAMLLLGDPAAPAREVDAPARPSVVVAATPTAGSMVSVTPARIADSRLSQQIPGGVAAMSAVTISVAGRGGVPVGGASAAALTVTAVSPVAYGHITVWPSGHPMSATSNLNFQPGQNIAATVIAPIGADGKIQLYNGSPGVVYLVVDVTGYVAAGSATAPGAIVPLSPARIADSRSNEQIVGAVPGLSAVPVKIAGRGGVPGSGVTAAILTVTAAGGSNEGFVVAWPTGVDRPLASNVNFQRGQSIANSVMVPVGADGAIQLFNGSLGSVILIVDVAGYIVAGSPTSKGVVETVTPRRLMDTRVGLNTEYRDATPADTETPVGVIGERDIAVTGVSAVILNVTAVLPLAAGHLTLWPSESARPPTSNINFAAGQTIPNLMIVPVGPDGKISLHNGAVGAVQVVIDVLGYLVDPPAPGDVIGWGQGLREQWVPFGSLPERLPDLADVRSVATRSWNSANYSVQRDGTVRAWGPGEQGQLGNGSRLDSAIPVKVSGLTDITAVESGDYGAIALRDDGTVWAWGDGAHGQLGGGTAGTGVGSTVARSGPWPDRHDRPPQWDRAGSRSEVGRNRVVLGLDLRPAGRPEPARESRPGARAHQCHRDRRLR